MEHSYFMQSPPAYISSLENTLFFFENTYIFLIPQLRIILGGLYFPGGRDTKFLSREAGGGSEKPQEENWDVKHTIRFDFPRSEQMYCDNVLPQEAKVTSSAVGDVQSRRRKPTTTSPPTPAVHGCRGPPFIPSLASQPRARCPAGTAAPAAGASPTLLR